MEQRHSRVSIPQGQGLGELAVHFIVAQAFGIQAVEPFDRRVDALDGVPGGVAHHPVVGEVEDALEGLHRLLGLKAENAVGVRDLGDGRVVVGDAVETDLELADLTPRAVEPQRLSGGRGGDASHGGILNNVDVGAVVVGQNAVGCEARLGQIHRAPLGQPVAGDGGAVAVLGEKRLHGALPAYVVIEDLTADALDVLKDIPPVDKVLIKAGGIGDVEVVAPGAVVFGVEAVEGVGDLGVHIGADGLLGPGGVDLAGGDVEDVVEEGDRHVLGGLIGLSQMDRNGLGDDGQTCGHGFLLPYRSGYFSI